MQLFSGNINYIIINDKKINSKDLVNNYFHSQEQNVLFLDKNKDNNLENELEIIENKTINGVPVLVFKTDYGHGHYVNVNSKIDHIECIKIFNKIFGKMYDPIYLTKTTEICKNLKNKINKLMDYCKKYPEEFGYAYSDYKINFGNGKVTIIHHEQLKNINVGGLLINPIDPSRFNTLEDFLTKISEGFAYFHVPEALNEITITDYKAQYA